MNYTLTVSVKSDQSTLLTLSGCITIRNMVALYYQLLEHSKAQQVLQLKIKEVEELDITFIQVLLALVRFHEIHQNPIDIQLDLSPDLIKQIHIAGLSKILNYNPS